MSDTEMQGAHDHGAGTTEADTDQAQPGRFRRLLASVGRGLRAIFRPVIIATVAAVVAAGALVVVAVEQREQTDWQRRQTCLAWYQIDATSYAGFLAGNPTDQQTALNSRIAADRRGLAYATEECGGALTDDDYAPPGADRVLTAEDEDRIDRILADEEQE